MLKMLNILKENKLFKLKNARLISIFIFLTKVIYIIYILFIIIIFVILKIGSDNLKKYLLIISVFILTILCSITTVYLIFNHQKVTYFETKLTKEYYMNLLAIEDENRNKDCVHKEVARIPALKYVDLLYEDNRINDDEKVRMLRNYGFMDEYMQTSIDDLSHPILKCLE